MKRILLILILGTSFMPKLFSQQSVARIWNEAQLAAIRIDAARPPVQARNLFHISMAMYDAWAAYDNVAKPYLLGNTINGTFYPFAGVPVPADVTVARNKAISFAVYRMMYNRYSISPNWLTTKSKIDSIFLSLGYNPAITSTAYISGDPAELGNYIAEKIIAMGLADGSNQANNYGGIGYTPSNAPLLLSNSGNATMTDINAWQPLTYVTCIDQNGNPCGTNTPNFVCPHWGNSFPFSMPKSSAKILNRAGTNYPVYHDPGVDPQLSLTNANDSSSDAFKWGHSMVLAWSSHLDANDPTMWDISPASKGNVANYPTDNSNLSAYYNFANGGDIGTGYPVNPATGLPYVPQLVKRGDYTRVVSQYWADGPTSETPPGHWFVLLNDVSDHPSFQKKYQGVGPVLSNLEWDVKSYFTLGTAMHDAAVACWGIKGYYDASRPISTIRKMCDLGQSSDILLPNYHPGGIKLIPGFIEQVVASDPSYLTGIGNVNVGKIKVKAWKAFPYIFYSNGTPINAAGVGWILAANWMPYQRETFVSPPFAGYISGHSTYSRAGATIMEKLTGNAYFPGGLKEFVVNANSTFIGFEKGPSTMVRLQWATYKDASDEASLSRIWGGIHPPFDDIPARVIGVKVANECFEKSKAYFYNDVPEITISSNLPNPVCTGSYLTFSASAINEPVNAEYIWRRNNIIVQAGNSNVLVTDAYANNDKFVCELKGNGFSVESQTITISTLNCGTCNLTANLFIQGYYNAAGFMKPVLMNQGIGANALLTDSVDIELHRSVSPYEMIAKKKVALMTNGDAVASFTCQQTNYYVVINHRNAVQTWSAIPMPLTVNTTYSFSNAAGKAYGNNQIQVEPGRFALYSGDISRDDNVDLQDFGLIEADNLNFESGFKSTDIDGDGNVDLGDMPFVEGNMNNFIFANYP